MAADPSSHRPVVLSIVAANAPVIWMSLGALTIFGLATRGAQYVQYRMLWLDEAAIAANVLVKSPGEIIGPLIHWQLAPPGFLLALEASTGVFGMTEYALRLPAFICALGAVVLFPVVARAAGSTGGAIIGLALFAASPQLVYYAAEVKPYSSDVFAALLLTGIALNVPWNDAPSWRYVACYAIAGTAAVWISFPAAFVLAGVGGTQLIAAFARGNRTAVVRLAVACGVWLLSFAALYVLVLSPLMREGARDTEGALVEQYWDYAFMPAGADTPAWLKHHLLQLFENPGGFHFTIFPAFIALTGAYGLLRKNPRACFMLGLPIVITLAVSAFKLYPFDGRLVLFLMPALFIFCGEGIAYLFEALTFKAHPVAWLALIVLVLPPFARGFEVFSEPIARHHLHEALEIAEQDWQTGDILYLQYPETVIYEFGKRRFSFDADAVVLAEPFDFAKLRHVRSIDPGILSSGVRRVWYPMTFSHYGEVVDFDARTASLLPRAHKIDVHGAAVLVYEVASDGN